MRVVLQVQGDQYFPEVKNKALFAYVGQNHFLKTPIHTEDKEGTIESCLGEIASENKRLLTAYNQTRKALESMVAAKEIFKKGLIECFIKFFPQKKESRPGESYLSKLNQMDKKPLAMIWSEGEEQEIHLLIHTLSLWVSTKQVESDVLFDYIDKIK